MSVFQEIPKDEWDAVLRKGDCGSSLMESGWAEKIASTLGFIAFRYYQYRDSHVLRVATIGSRVTTAPFSDGSDVVSLAKTPLDLRTFQKDAREAFGNDARLRINERFAPIEEHDASQCVAHEYVVDLGVPILPEVRKTLRHILQKPIMGTIERATEEADIDAAYLLYLRHMRSVRNFVMVKDLFTAMLKEQGGELWVWHNGNAPQAMAIFIPSATEVLYSLSAASYEAQKENAPHHLVYQALEYYKKSGLEYASLGSTGKDSNLEVFKRGWRGQQFHIYEFGERSGVSRTSRIRDMVRFVPLPMYQSLTRLLGRHFL